MRTQINAPIAYGDYGVVKSGLRKSSLRTIVEPFIYLFIKQIKFPFTTEHFLTFSKQGVSKTLKETVSEDH
jgi:hypothetical protein